MSMSTVRSGGAARTAAYGGFADAAGGVATIVLAVAGLANAAPDMMTSIATIVFGAALLIEGGAMMSEYALIAMPASAGDSRSSLSSLPAIFLAGAAGIVLGVLALLGIHAVTLVATAIIAYGTALVLSSSSMHNMQLLKNTRPETLELADSAGEILANELAHETAGMQALAGLAAIVLGILAIAGSGNAATLSLVALLALGGALILTGTTLSATVLRFMRPQSGGYVGDRSITRPGE